MLYNNKTHSVALFAALHIAYGATYSLQETPGSQACAIESYLNFDSWYIFPCQIRSNLPVRAQESFSKMSYLIELIKQSIAENYPLWYRGFHSLMGIICCICLPHNLQNSPSLTPVSHSAGSFFSIPTPPYQSCLQSLGSGCPRFRRTSVSLVMR